MFRRALLSVLGAVVLVTACGAPDPVAAKKGGGGSGDDDGTPTDPGKKPGGADAPPLGTPPAAPSEITSTGAVKLTLTADKGAASDAVVSFGMPFPQGVFKDVKNITLKDKAGKAVKIHTSALATWPGDASLRSVLVAFKATLAQGATEEWTVDYGAAGTGGDAGDLKANPNGPVLATLTADHYAASHVSGIVGTAAKNAALTAAYETEVENGFKGIDYSTFGVNCPSSSSHRTYYDGPHAQYQWAIRTGKPERFRRAHEETNWYRANELQWIDGKTMAISKCQPAAAAWTPDKPMDWGTLRMMTAQGNLDDYLLTGDPAAKEAVIAMGKAYLANIPALQKLDGQTGKPILQITERNMGWTIMGLASYYALDHGAAVKDATQALVKQTFDWQKAGTSGALEHDIERPDPEECIGGPKGGSPFMSSLLVDGMMDWWLLTAEPGTKDFMVKLATWYEKSALTADKTAFKYLVGCSSLSYEKGDANGDPDGYTTSEINMLILHVFGATYALSKDKHWTTFGDSLIPPGIEEMFVKRPKQWNQANRTFGKYLGYRAM